MPRAYCLKCGKTADTKLISSMMKKGLVPKCKRTMEIKASSKVSPRPIMNAKVKKEVHAPTQTLFGLQIPITLIHERHSQLKSDPKSNLAVLRPKNEDTEKDKFRTYWNSYD